MDFKIKTIRCEWQVVIEDVDQYDQSTGKHKVLSSWPSYQQAYDDLPNHGIEHQYVKRWIPKSPEHPYQFLKVQYTEVDISQKK